MVRKSKLKSNKKKREKKQPNHVADAIIGGVFGATLGWFYKRDETQEVIKRIRESEQYQNFAADVYESAEENIRQFITMNIENQTRNLLMKNTPSLSKRQKDLEGYEDDDEVLDDEYEDDEEEEYEEQSYEELVEDNKQLKKAISKLEAKFDRLLEEE